MTEPRSPMLCPICHRPIGDHPAATAAKAPFCSTRCAEIDLGRWLTGGYVIPGPDPAAGDDSADKPMNDLGEPG